MGTGFGTRGVCTQGCVERKNLRPPSAAKIFFPPGCENFFSAGGFISRQGCDFAKKVAKNRPTGVSKFFFPAGSLTLGCTPPMPSAGGCVG